MAEGIHDEGMHDARAGAIMPAAYSILMPARLIVSEKRAF